MSLGGPGWLTDIFDCKFVFDHSCYTLVPDVFHKKQTGDDAQMKSFDGRGAISGKLVVVPPEGRSISHNGIEITLASNTGACSLARRVLHVPNDHQC